jgi:hypothetical protein
MMLKRGGMIMKKNMYAATVEATSTRTAFAIPTNGDFTSLLDPKVNRYPPLVSRPSYICEKSPSFQIKLAKEDLERGRNHFFKNKILTIWKSKRSFVEIVPQFPKPFAPIIYQMVYQAMSPFLASAYKEDFQLPLLSFTFFSWLQYTRLTAQMMGEMREAEDWGEIKQFFHHCVQYEWLHDLFAGKDHS